MVDIVRGADIVRQAVEIVDGGKDIVDRDVLGDQVVTAGEQLLLEHILILAALFKHLHEDGVLDLLIDAAVFKLFPGQIDKRSDIDHAVADHLDLNALGIQIGLRNAVLLDLVRLLAGDNLAGLGQNLARGGIHHRLHQLVARQTGGDAQLLIIFIPAHAGEIVPVRVKEQAVQMGLRRVERRGLAGAQLAVDLEQRLLRILGGILFNRGEDALVTAEKVADVRVTAQAERADKGSDEDLSVFINADIEQVVLIRLIF